MSAAAQQKPVGQKPKHKGAKKSYPPRMTLEELMEQTQLPRVTKPKEVRRELNLLSRKYLSTKDIEKLEAVHREMLEQGVSIKRPIPIKNREGKVIESLNNFLFFGVAESKVPHGEGKKEPRRRKHQRKKKKKQKSGE